MVNMGFSAEAILQLAPALNETVSLQQRLHVRGHHFA